MADLLLLRGMLLLLLLRHCVYTSLIVVGRHDHQVQCSSDKHCAPTQM